VGENINLLLKSVPILFCSPKILHRLIRDQCRINLRFPVLYTVVIENAGLLDLIFTATSVYESGCYYSDVQILFYKF